jgi:hypothetical protein
MRLQCGHALSYWRRDRLAWWALLFALCPAAHATDWSDLQVAFGVKAWATEWTSWAPTPGGGASGVQVVESVAANTHMAEIPQASLRFGDFVASGSYLANTDYSLGGAVNASSGLLESLKTSRSELDGNVGYFVLDTLAITVGYKQIEQAFGIDHYKWTGPTIGLLGSAPLKGSLGLYGTFAYGRLSMKASVPDVIQRDNFSADYLLGELGLSYGVSTPLYPLSFTVTLGYRAQVVSTRRYDLATGLTNVATGIPASVAVDVHDVTYGPALSLVARF